MKYPPKPAQEWILGQGSCNHFTQLQRFNPRNASLAILVDVHEMAVVEDLNMHVALEWPEIALRLALTVIAGVLLGLNRSERGRPAGLCTATLVCLAASVSMIQVNLLLNMHGKASDSFITNDLMRLPLGILTGMGFIGGGAILRRGNAVQGVTTAATLWFATVLGLCLGSGQLVLGLAGLVLGLATLWGMKSIENHLREDRSGTLTIVTAANGPTDGALRDVLTKAGFVATSWSVAYRNNKPTRHRAVQMQVHWRGQRTDDSSPPFVEQLAALEGVVMVRWKA